MPRMRMSGTQRIGVTCTVCFPLSKANLGLWLTLQEGLLLWEIMIIRGGWGEKGKVWIYTGVEMYTPQGEYEEFLDHHRCKIPVICSSNALGSFFFHNKLENVDVHWFGIFNLAKNDIYKVFEADETVSETFWRQTIDFYNSFVKTDPICIIIIARLRSLG